MATTGTSVTQPNKTGTEVGLQAQGMALQLANVMSQTRLNESQAEKNKAEAEKISGVDTKAQEATIELDSANFKRKSEERTHLRTNQSSRCRRGT